MKGSSRYQVKPSDRDVNQRSRFPNPKMKISGLRSHFRALRAKESTPLIYILKDAADIIEDPPNPQMTQMHLPLLEGRMLNVVNCQEWVTLPCVRRERLAIDS